MSASVLYAPEGGQTRTELLKDQNNYSILSFRKGRCIYYEEVFP